MMHLRLRERSHLRSRRPSSGGALGAAEAGSDYFSSDKHYASLARRIVAALHCGGGWVLITGDPPADPQALSEALGNVAGVRYEVIIISCGPELTREDLERTVPVVARPRTATGATVTPEFSLAASPLFVFDNFDRLSDKQIEEIYKGTLRCGQIPAAGILLASLDFLARLERTALRFLKEHLDAHFRVQEVGDDEAITFLHNQLLVQRDRQIEARGFRHGILVGLAASGVLLAAGMGLFIVLNTPAGRIRPAPESAGEMNPISEEGSMLHPPKEGVTNSEPVQAAPKTETRSASATTSPPPVSAMVVESPATVVAHPPADLHSSESTGERRPISEEGSLLHPPKEGVTNSEPVQAAPKTETRSASATTSPPPVSATVVESPATVVANPPADLHSSDAEIATLVRRGDAFLTSGDITSARLFYERAADAGSGLAAFQLGATFDPVILGRVGARAGIADRAQALLWYRRARDLGIVEAVQRIKRFEAPSLGAQDNRSH